MLTFGSVFQTAPLLDTLAVVKLKNSELILPHYYIHFVQNTSNTGSQMHEAPLHRWYTDLRFEIVTFSHAKIPLVILDKYSACTAIHVTQQSSVD